MPSPTQTTASIQDTFGQLTIGEGYVVRGDGVAVALIELSVPDLRLYDTGSLEQLLAQYTQVLYACPDRCSLLTIATPMDVTPLIRTLEQSQSQAQDFRSYAILGALADWLTHAWSGLVHLRRIRWIVALPSIAPELPPRGTWGELFPATIVGQVTHLQGEPISEVLTRARRLIGQLATLGIEPGPVLLTAPAIRGLLRAGLDPMANDLQQSVATIPAPRPLQTTTIGAMHAT